MALDIQGHLGECVKVSACLRPLGIAGIVPFVFRLLERIIVYNIVMWQSQIKWSAAVTARFREKVYQMGRNSSDKVFTFFFFVLLNNIFY